jgi:hypothetical protein
LKNPYKLLLPKLDGQEEINFNVLEVITNEEFSTEIKHALNNENGKLVKVEHVPDSFIQIMVLDLETETITAYNFNFNSERVDYIILTKVDVAVMYKSFGDYNLN